jgi:hypothetical protein
MPTRESDGVDGVDGVPGAEGEGFATVTERVLCEAAFLRGGGSGSLTQADNSAAMDTRHIGLNRLPHLIVSLARAENAELHVRRRSESERTQDCE